MMLRLFRNKGKFKDTEIKQELIGIFCDTLREPEPEKLYLMKYGDSSWNKEQHKKLLINIEKSFSISLSNEQRELCQNYPLILNVVKMVLKNGSRYIEDSDPD